MDYDKKLAYVERRLAIAKYQHNKLLAYKRRMYPLTKRQAEVMQFIRANEVVLPAPKIAKHFGWASLNSVYSHLMLIEQKGYLVKRPDGKYSVVDE